MVFWRRRKEEKRSIESLPWDVGGTLSSPAVNQATALTLTPVYAAGRHIADNVSTLPLQPYRKDGDRRRRLSTLPQLFRILADDGELGDWLFAALTSLALRGNAVGLITGRDGMGFPTVIRWVPMDEIFVDDSNPTPAWWWKGRPVDRGELVHIPWFKIAGRTLGLSPIEAYALTVTSGLEAQRFGTGWFQAGGVPPGTFKNSQQTVDANQADMIRARLVASIRSRRPLVYGADWDYNAITIPPEQAQFIEAMKVSANQIAAIYGIAPEEIGGEAANSLTYTNEEHRHIRRMADLRPWMVRLETKFSSWLPDRTYVRFNAVAPVRVDAKTQVDIFKVQREIGFASIDEQRTLIDLDPLPNGAGADYTPLGQMARQPIPGEPLLLQPSANGDKPIPLGVS